MANNTSPDPGSSPEPTVPAQPLPSEGPLEVDVGLEISIISSSLMTLQDDDALDRDSTYNPS